MALQAAYEEFRDALRAAEQSRKDMSPKNAASFETHCRNLYRVDDYTELAIAGGHGAPTAWRKAIDAARVIASLEPDGLIVFSKLWILLGAIAEHGDPGEPVGEDEALRQSFDDLVETYERLKAELILCQAKLEANDKLVAAHERTIEVLEKSKRAWIRVGNISTLSDNKTEATAKVNDPFGIGKIGEKALEKYVKAQKEVGSKLLKVEPSTGARGLWEVLKRNSAQYVRRIASHGSDTANISRMADELDRIEPNFRTVSSDSPPDPSTLPDLSIFRDAEWSPEMMVIPAGRFIMGSPSDEQHRRDGEGPQHEVTIARHFALGRFPVTFEDYDRYCYAAGMEQPTDGNWGRARRPVINVSWDDARGYITWLNETLGLSEETYRLPSEAEWEYACRAGTAGRFSFGDDTAKLGAHAWYGDNSAGKPHPVGEKSANPWGLFDMHGNVWEWTGDSWHGDYAGAPVNGSAWLESDEYRTALRGGSWYGRPWNLRAANRDGFGTGSRESVIGFRVARTLSR